MYARENVQHTLFRQSVFNTDPGTPAGTLVPRDAKSVLVTDRNKLDNAQIFTDGFEREFALGNFNVAYTLGAICNLNFFGALLIAISGVNPAPSGQGITSIAVTSGGTGYTTPTLIIPAPPAGGVQATGTLTVGAGIITAVIITNPGAGYTGTVTPTIGTPGGGTGGVLANAVLGTTYSRVFRLCAPGLPGIYHELEEGVIGSPSLYYKYLDLIGQKLSCKWGVEGIMAADLAMVGSGNQLAAPGASPLDAAASELTGAPGEYANITTLQDGSDPGNVTDLAFDIDRKVITKRVHGASGKAKALLYGKSMVRGTLTKYFESDADWLKARSATLIALKSTLTSGFYSLEASMPEVKLKPSGLKIDSEDGVMQPFEFSSLRKSNTTDTPIKLTLVNGVAAYA